MKVPRRKPLNARIGVMSIGLDTYWKQFDGLLNELLTKTEVFKKKITHIIPIANQAKPFLLLVFLRMRSNPTMMKARQLE